MADDQRDRTGRRAKSYAEGDVERSHHRRRTPHGGVPLVEMNDEDGTPPPQAPPSMEGVPVEQQVEILRKSLDEHAAGLERVWRDRNLHEQVQTLLQDNAATNELMREFLVPAVKNVQGRLATMEQSGESSRAKAERFWDYEWPQIVKTLGELGTHLTRIEKDVDRLERSLDQFTKKYEDLTSSLGKRIDELKSMDDKQEHRLRKLEDWRLALTTKIALLSALGGAGIAGAWELIKHFT